MILVDTSIWVAHARTVNETLSDLLAREAVLGHPFVIGELALGGFKPATLRILGELPSALLATNDEVLTLILATKTLQVVELDMPTRIWSRPLG